MSSDQMIPNKNNEAIRFNRRRTRHLFTALAVYILFQFLIPPIEPISKGGMGVLGIFLALIYLLFVEEGITWPSFLAVGLLGFTNVASANNIIKESWGSAVSVFVAATLLLNYAMTETGLIHRIAIWFITRPFLKGRPWMILFMYFFSAFLLNLVSTSSPIVVMYLAISEGIFKSLGNDDKEDKFNRSVVLAMGWVAQGAQAMTPIAHTMVVLVLGYIFKDFGVNVSILQFSMIFLCWGLVYLVGIWLIFRYVMRPDVSRLSNFDIDAMRATIPPMGKRERTVAIVLVILVVFWISPDLLKLIPFMLPIGSYIGLLGQTIPVLVAVGALCAINSEGAPVLDLKAGTSKITWGPFFLISALQVFGYAIDLKEVGIGLWMTQIFAPLTSGLSAWAFVAAVIAFMLIATNLLSNAICAMLYTVIVPIAMLIPGVSPIAIGLIVASSANADSLLTPASCPVSGLLVSSGYVNAKFMATYGWMLMIFAFVGYLLVGYPLSVAVFG